MSGRLIELAERCEAASGPDAGLWGLIVLTTGLCKGEADPTASLDAAMSLVPEGHGWSLGTADPKAWAGVFSCEQDGEIVVEAATPALALTAACLRARAALNARAVLKDSEGCGE